QPFQAADDGLSNSSAWHGSHVHNLSPDSRRARFAPDCRSNRPLTRAIPNGSPWTPDFGRTAHARRSRGLFGSPARPWRFTGFSVGANYFIMAVRPLARASVRGGS